MHARTDLHLGLCCDDQHLLICVADGAPAFGEPADSEQPDDDESGRGMLIVATVAADFGWRRREDRPGKIMWVLLALHLED
jgi:anti-sigma regulatory factor (Ser/Thr protein kinase)